MDSIVTGVIQAVGSLAALTPLVNALHKWHVAIRKISAPANTAVSRQSADSTVAQGSGRLSTVEWVAFVVGVAFIVWGLYGFIVRLGPASRGEIVVAALEVATLWVLLVAMVLLAAARGLLRAIARTGKMAELLAQAVASTKPPAA